jgi:hypothetical protein
MDRSIGLLVMQSLGVVPAVCDSDVPTPILLVVSRSFSWCGTAQSVASLMAVRRLDKEEKGPGSGADDQSSGT